MLALPEDLSDLRSHFRSHLSDYEDKTLLVTGATGFIGKWILIGCDVINQLLIESGRKSLRVFAISRNPERFLQSYPEFRNIRVHWIQSDITELNPVEISQKLDYIIHGATDVISSQLPKDLLGVFQTCVTGTEKVLEIARQSKAKRFLLLSSGAVYGEPKGDTSLIDEVYRGRLDWYQSRAAYAEGKRASETLALLYSQTYGFEMNIARGFAFVGPYLPLDTHFAIGNFIGHFLRNENIVIKGDGTAVRSYLYAVDMVNWIFRMLTQGKNQISYNLGSDQGISIRQLAEAVVKASEGKLSFEVLGTPAVGAAPSYYVPGLDQNKELNLKIGVGLDESIERTIKWSRSRGA